MSPIAVSLEGKKALVTGGKRGIGRGIALKFAAAGADVAVCSRGADELEAVAGEIRRLGRRGLAVPADVSRRADVAQMVGRVVDEFGAIDVLVNAAGVITWEKPLLELSEEDWDSVIDTNLKGCFLCSQAVAREMAKRQRGAIINIASIVAHLPASGTGNYNVSKAGIVMLTRTLAVELCKLNIRVNAISPGWIKTEMNTDIRSDPAAEEAITKTIPFGRWGEPEDIAGVALFLASDLAAYVSGQTISVDGDLVDAGLLGQTP